MNEFRLPAWSSDVRKVLAGLALGMAGAGLIYAAAATAAGIIAETFSTSETEGHSRAVAFTVGLDRALSERQASLAKCEPGSGTRRRACIAVTDARALRAQGAVPR